MTEKEMKKLNTIKEILGGECTKKEAVESLGINIRQINRLILKYKNEGNEGFIHKNKGRQSKKKISEDIKEEIVNLYIAEYFDYNFTHFYEEIKEKYHISYRAVGYILSEADIISPEAQHKTVTLYNANMKKAIRQKEATNEQITIYKKRQEAEKQKHIRRSSLLYNYGQEVQMDAAFAMWYGEKARALHLAVDKATKKVLYGWFDVQETTRAYFVMLMNIVSKYGIPKKIKTDKRGTFSINNVKTKSNLNTTQEANKYLNDVFIPKMNSKFAYEINPEKNDMRDNNYSLEELNIIISEQYIRKMDNSSSIKYKGNYYVPVDIETGEIISFSRNTSCTLIVAYDYTYWCNIEDKLYILSEIKAPEKKTYQRTTKTIEEINRSKAHKPAPNHPWRNYKKN